MSETTKEEKDEDVVMGESKSVKEEKTEDIDKDDTTVNDIDGGADNGKDEDDSEEEEEKVEPPKPLATTRSRRANAGNRMGHLIQEEEDEFYTNIYGGFLEEEDDVDFNDEEEDNDGDEADDNSDSSSSSESDSDSSVDETAEVESEDHQTVDRKPLKKSAYKTSKLRTQSRSKSNTSQSSSKQQPSKSTPIPQSPSLPAYEACARICSVCLGEHSEQNDEIIECDSCHITVHESCYGISSSDESHEVASVHSNISSESTEPWFCEPCRRSEKNPQCELCPNSYGIFKETDTGRWVHMVCALYTRGVTFNNTENLTGVSLFELNYGLYGSKACTICEDRRLARSGICVGCDAGLCKTFFHPTCAQKEGFLFESHSDEVDPYFAQCRQHADKTTIKRKKKTCTALFARLKRVQPLQTCSERIKRKLDKITQQSDPHKTKWTPDNRPPIPFKVSRMLMTSPSLIIKLTKKSELLGLDPNSAFMNVQDEMEMARQKWHIPPAFDLEFVAYCRDRATRMVTMKKRNIELVSQNATLKHEETSLREKYNSIKGLVDKVKAENDALIQEARALQRTVTIGTGKPFSLPLQIEQLISRCTNLKTKSPSKSGSKATSKQTSATHECGKCKTVKDQHLLALCDTCKFYIHIYCLDPPLSRVPKKTKFGGWQCSDCSERDEEEQEEALDEQNMIAIQEVDGPRRLRERIKYPEKYCHESMMLADFWSTSKKKSKKVSKSNKAKKSKIEIPTR